MFLLGTPTFQNQWIFIWIIFQATDQNQDYGAVYEGRDVSKTTDVNPDYDDYDYFHA